MSAINKILVPYDFSHPAEVALNYAAAFCGDDAGKQITLIYVMEDGANESEVQTKLQDAIEAASKKTKANFSSAVTKGSLNDGILSTQKEGSHHIIFMGTKGSQELEGTKGTNTSELVLEADCPVLVIPDQCPPFAVNNIALALGKGEIDDSFALGVLHDIAREYDAKVHILTIESEEGGEVITEDKNEGVLEYYLETLDYRHSFPKNSDIEEGISNYVRERNIDMVAILPRNHAKKSKPSEGRLTRLLTLHAEVPVLTID